MMLSALNMLLRDRYPSLAELCAAEGLDKSYSFCRFYARNFA